MGNLAVGLKQIYGGMKTIFGRGGARKASKAAQTVVPKYQGPTITQMAERMPLALPAPSAEALAAARPRVNVGKALNRNLDELRMSQVITKDGTHVRYYRGAESDKILLKTADKGTLHQEWIYGGSPEQLTYVKSTGGGDRYIMRRDGNFVQVEKSATQYKDGINQTISTNDLYFADGAGSGFHRRDVKGLNGAETAEFSVKGNVTVFPGKEYEKIVPYQLENAGIGRHDRGDVYKVLSEIYVKHGDEAAYHVQQQINRYRDLAESKFIRDFDDALFSTYKA